ncbi:MAG: hypothetical protein NZ750_09640 [Anaerolineae bacterium]|nr:hypothetical protein [Anaerolineae bacterium]MDW8171882.1 hypothetical protein [Anaerolineae bacterium]
MPIENRWYAEPRIVLNRMYGEVTISDLAKSNEINQAYYQQIERSVLLHFIVDMREVTLGFNDVRAARVLSGPRPNTGWIMLVTNDPMHKMIAAMISMIAHLRYKVVDSMEQALDFLRTRDAALWPLIGKPKDDDSVALD